MLQLLFENLSRLLNFVSRFVSFVSHFHSPFLQIQGKATSKLIIQNIRAQRLDWKFPELTNYGGWSWENELKIEKSMQISRYYIQAGPAALNYGGCYSALSPKCYTP